MKLRESTAANFSIDDGKLRDRLAIAVSEEGITEYDLSTSEDEEEEDPLQRFKKKFGTLAVLETP